MNNVNLIGNLTSAPTERAAGVVSMRVACNERWTSNGTKHERAHFFDVVAFGRQGAACLEHLSKGSQVGVFGSLSQNRWEDKESGEPRSRVEIKATSVDFLGGRRANTPAPAADEAPADADATAEEPAESAPEGEPKF